MTTSNPGETKRKRRSNAKDAAKAPSIIARLVKLGYEIPDEELMRLPRDSAKNLDHYLDGSPKQP